MLRDFLSDLRYRFRAFFRAADVERELAEELRFHLDEDATRLERGGLEPEEAQRRARLALGGIEHVKEQSRDTRGVRLVEQVVRDLAHALRIARKHPGFASVVVLSLSLGLGATTAVFNLTYNVLFAPLALPHAEQLVALVRVDKSGPDIAFTRAEVRALQEAPGAGSLVAMRTASQISMAVGETREYINLHFVDGAFFSVIGARPLQGRLLTPDDDARQAAVVVISERLAKRLFPADSSAVGRIIRIRDMPFTVVGVTPRSFRGLEYPGFFTAAVPQSAASLTGLGDNLFSRHVGDAFEIVGRLAKDQERVRPALALTFQRCCAADRAGARQWLDVIDIRRGIPNGKGDNRSEVSTILMALLTGMGLVLVVVCCNIASLLFVRAAARQREIAVRLSLGASRARLVSQLILENVPLALLGGAGGLVLAAWFTSLFVGAMPADWIEFVEMIDFRSSPAVLMFTGAATLACAMVFAVYPALRATNQRLAQTLRLDARSSRTRGQGAVARGVVVAQVAVTVVLVTAASLLTVTLGNLSRADGGFASDNLLLASFETRSTRYERGGMLPLHEEIARRVLSVPGVRAAALATLVPLYGGNTGWLRIDVPGYSTPSGDTSWVQFNASTPGFLSTSGIRLLSGRDFTPADRTGAVPVVIVSAAFARRYFGERDPVGLPLGVVMRGDELTAALVVGVAGDAKYSDLRSAPVPMLYMPVAQTTELWRTMQLVVRVEGDGARTAPALMRAIETAAPGIRVRRVRDMHTQRDASVALERLAARLATFVSVMALALSMVGLYGVVAYSVARRTSELGIRIALGARARTIAWLVVRETIGFVGAGVLIGMPLSFAANGALASQLFGVGAHNPAVVAVSILLLAAVAVLATVIPARRAVRIDPRIALSAD